MRGRTSHFEQELKHKKMAERLRESVAGGISIEKVHKMIHHSIHRHAEKVEHGEIGCKPQRAFPIIACAPSCRAQYSSNRARDRSGPRAQTAADRTAGPLPRSAFVAPHTATAALRLTATSPRNPQSLGQASLPGT